MRELPDGSGYFVGIVGSRESGILNFLQYTKKGQARCWLFVWRMQRDYYQLSREFGSPISRWRALYLAVRILI